MTEHKKSVVVIGGGITGLTAAYYLQQTITEEDGPWQILLVEASHRLGGKIHTVCRDGFVIEKGPDSFLERKESTKSLLRELDLEKEMIQSQAGNPQVLINNKLHSLPEGSIYGVPTKVAPFLTTDLFSIPGKMRAAADLVIPRKKEKGDMSLGGFFRRRLGDEVVENMIEPLLSGVYPGDIDQLSLNATFPQVNEIEKQYRSLILGIKRGIHLFEGQSCPNRILTLQGGLQTLVDKIEQKLPRDLVLKGVKVQSIHPSNDHNGYTLALNTGENIIADAVVSAMPHPSLLKLLPDFGPLKTYKQMPASSVASVTMAFSENRPAGIDKSTGFVVSRNSDLTITASTWLHKIWPHTAPEGKMLLRSFIGRAGEETVVDLSDDEIESIVLQDLRKTLNLSADPEFTVVSRWKNAMPQYTVGHAERLFTLKERMRETLPGFFVAGSSFGGHSLPDCVEQGKVTAGEVVAYMKNTVSPV